MADKDRWRRVRRPFWIAAGVALLGKLAEWTLSWNFPLAEPASAVLLIAAIVLVRRLIRKFLYRVSRRLAAAFMFIGVVPLFFAGVLALLLGAAGLFQVTASELGRTLDDVQDDVDRMAARLARGEPIDARDDLEFKAATWSMADERPELPAWLGDRASGLIVRGGRPYFVSLRSNDETTAIVTVAFDQSLLDVVERDVEVELQPLDPVSFTDRDVVDAPTSPLFEGADSTVALGRDISITFSPEESQTFYCAVVLDWASGDTLRMAGDIDEDLDVDRTQIPIVGMRYETMPTMRRQFTNGPYGRPLLHVAKVVTIVLASLAAIAVIVGVALTSSVTRAVNALYRGTERVGSGDLDHRIRVGSNDQLGALAASFNEMTESVQEAIDVRAERDRLEHELQFAADVQRAMLPTEFPVIPGLSGAATSVMAREVGGDLYDFVRIGVDRLAIVVGDVSGKGVAAALVMSNVVSSIRSVLGTSADGPAAVLTRLNDVLYGTTAPGVFVTLFYAEYDMATGGLVYANAGHDWPIVRRVDGALEDLESGSIMLGALPDIDVHERRVDLAPGDLVVLYSDGLVDTETIDGEPFDRERVIERIRNGSGGPKARVDALRASVEAWRGEAPEIDDVTIVVLERTATPGSGG